jgi:hypothetical protein
MLAHPLPGRPRAIAASLVAVSTSLTALATLAGCGGVHGIPIGSTATQIAQTVCPKAYQCCTLSQLSGNGQAGTDEASCETMTTSAFESDLETIQASQDQKRATFDNDKLQACLTTIRSASCDTLDMTNHLVGIPGCESFVDPLVAVGGACSQDYECIDGWCQQPADMSGGDGACRPHAQLGASCVTASCEPGLTCDLGASDDTCVRAGAIGATCTDLLQCASANCAIPAGADSGVCAAATDPQCFYASGCDAAGGGRPGVGTALLLAAFVLTAMWRVRGPRRF